MESPFALERVEGMAASRRPTSTNIPKTIIYYKKEDITITVVLILPTVLIILFTIGRITSNRVGMMCISNNNSIININK